MTDTTRMDMLQAERQKLLADERGLKVQLEKIEGHRMRIEAEIAEALCGIPVGAIVEIRKKHWRSGRWRVTGHVMRFGDTPELKATKLLKDGSDGKMCNVSLWIDSYLRVVSAPTLTEVAEDSQ